MVTAIAGKLDKNSPNSTSSDYDCMEPFWRLVDNIMGGINTMRMAGEEYLPKFPDEEDTQYRARLAAVKFTNIYRDIIENITGRPFQEETKLVDGASDQMKAISEDIDGKGNNLNVFAQTTFFSGINNAIDWILIDYPKVRNSGDLTVADEKRAGLRPFWVQIPARDMLMVQTARIGAIEEVVYARFIQRQKIRAGYGEVEIAQVKIMERERIEIIDEITGHVTVTYGQAQYQVFEAKQTVLGRNVTVGSNDRIDWVEIDQGPITIGVIPLVPFLTGRRKGTSWDLFPPMKDVADAQLEHYQAESNLKMAEAMSCFPMLTGNGVKPPTDSKGKPAPLPYGPRTVLYAPPAEIEGQQPSWAWLEISASSLAFLAKQIDKIEEQMREMGRQPLIAKSSGSLTAATAESVAQKSNSAVKQWALQLKDSLEWAWHYTALWLKSVEEVEVFVFTDFSVTADGDMATLQTMRTGGDLSQDTLWAEAQRRGVLSPNFDGDEEKKLIAEEAPSPVDVNNQRAAMGLPPLPVDPLNPNDPANKPPVPGGPQPPPVKKPVTPPAKVPVPA